MAGILNAQQVNLTTEATQPTHVVRLQEFNQVINNTVYTANLDPEIDERVYLVRDAFAGILVLSSTAEFIFDGLDSRAQTLIIFNNGNFDFLLKNKVDEVTTRHQFDFGVDLRVTPKTAITLRNLTGSWNKIA